MTHSTNMGFIHNFLDSEDGNKMTLLLLHGTGGTEDDLVQLGREISSTAGILSPRGRVLENGAPRFFRRLAEGVFDIDDLKFRTNELADFVEKASKFYHFDSRIVIAVGYSNGANIASSLLLLRPEVLSAAILFRSMVPLIPDRARDLSEKNIFVSGGLHDPIVAKRETEKLVELFKVSGAKVFMHWEESGHELTIAEVTEASRWLSHTSE